ncbi:conserved hypothetical protein [Cupriavidus taiwanensis]|nr:conserved hypothetical protein [Cupriavidus taiwanensis]SPD62638.1 conserved protein of unknown function [Cupriavidus neocaledonicus]SOZ00650.1 conserved hypothetical protein [Cupriavidus taiwanensis]SOZ21657.1 conserved hypothetical protein [Cupriavidus taiwanensis]SPD61924.1 conserved protein of unknown function [Cupriavidus taiwanensis]
MQELFCIFKLRHRLVPVLNSRSQGQQSLIVVGCLCLWQRLEQGNEILIRIYVVGLTGFSLHPNPTGDSTAKQPWIPREADHLAGVGNPAW